MEEKKTPPSGALVPIFVPINNEFIDNEISILDFGCLVRNYRSKFVDILNHECVENFSKFTSADVYAQRQSFLKIIISKTVLYYILTNFVFNYDEFICDECGSLLTNCSNGFIITSKRVLLFFLYLIKTESWAITHNENIYDILEYEDVLEIKNSPSSGFSISISINYKNYESMERCLKNNNTNVPIKHTENIILIPIDGEDLERKYIEKHINLNNIFDTSDTLDNLDNLLVSIFTNYEDVLKNRANINEVMEQS